MWVLGCWPGSAYHSPLGSQGTSWAGSSPRRHPCIRSGGTQGVGRGPRRLPQRWVQRVVQQAQEMEELAQEATLGAGFYLTPWQVCQAGVARPLSPRHYGDRAGARAAEAGDATGPV